MPAAFTYGTAGRDIVTGPGLDDFEPVDKRRPVPTAVRRFVHAAARHAEIEMGGVARIDNNRMQFWSVRRAILRAAHPVAVLGIVVEAWKRLPAHASVFGAEKSVWRGARIPRIGFACVARCEPERVINHAALFALARFGESGRPRRLFPAFAEIRRTEHRGAQVAGLRGGEQRAAVARIKHDVIDDMAEEVRSVGPP